MRIAVATPIQKRRLKLAYDPRVFGALSEKVEQLHRILRVSGEDKVIYHEGALDEIVLTTLHLVEVDVRLRVVWPFADDPVWNVLVHRQ